MAPIRIDNTREVLIEYANSRGLGTEFDGWSEEAAVDLVRDLAHYLDHHGYSVQGTVDIGLALAAGDGVDVT